MINCDQIAVESARLKTMFAKCYNLKAIDLRSIVDLIESVSACSGGSFNLKTVNGQSLLGIGDIIVTAVVDGTETKVQQGTGITVSGNGSVANPYVITNSSTSVADGSETKINQGSNITIAGTGTSSDPYVINAVIPAGTAQVNADWAAISGISMILNKPNIPTKTSDLVNDGADGINQFVVVGQEQQQSLQEVINVNKTADRVEFLFNTVNGGKLRGAFVYLEKFLIDPLNPTKTYLYGSFDTLDNAASANIVRINEDASMDTTFAVGSGFNGFPYSGSELIATPDGTLYVSGSFTNYNGINANRIISLNPDGSVNTAFAYGTGFNGITGGLAFNVAKTHIYVTGLFNNYNGTPTNGIIKLALNGTIDGTFVYGSGFNNTTVDVFVDADDSLFVTGYFGSYNGNSSPKLAKILPNGSFDATFVVGTGFNTGNGQSNFIFRNQAGVLICYGYFTAYNGTGARRVIALNNDGTISGAYNFGTGFDGDIYGLDQLPNGKYVVEGGFTEFNGTASNGFIILNADFTIYSTYTELYHSPAVGTNAIYALIDIADYSQIVNIEAGVPITQRKLTFSEVNGKAEYLIGGLENVSSEEVMPRRLIQELIDENKTIVIDDLTTGGSDNALSAEQGKILKELYEDNVIHTTGDESKQGVLTLETGLKLTGNTTSSTATDINVQETDGTVNKMKPDSLPLTSSPTNFSPTSQTLGGFIAGIDSKIGENTASLSNLSNNKLNTSEKGANNGVATLGSDGKVPNNQIPALAISETFPVSSQAQMLGLSQADQGDVAIRSDISKSFILRQAPSSILGNWSELLSPTGVVTSVAGKVGVVTLNTSDIGGLQTALDSKANDADVVHKTGNLTESINGLKTFTSPLIVFTSGFNDGISSFAENGAAVYGVSTNGVGVAGASQGGVAVSGSSLSGVGGVFNSINGPKITSFQANDIEKSYISSSGGYVKTSAPATNILLAGGSDVAQNTAFNKNFGTIAGTVVEGGTLGTNAYSSTAYLPLSGGTLAGMVTATSYTATSLPVFENNAAASSLAVGQFYRTSIGVLMVKF